VVDVIRAGRAIVDLDHVAHQLDQVVGGDGSRGALDLVVQPQALVQLVAPDALQIVTALVKELADQVLAGVVQGRGIAGAHPLVELQQGCFGDGLAFPQVPLWLHLHCAGQVPVIGIVVGLGIERQKLFVRAGLDWRDLAVAVIHSGQGAQQDGDRHGALAVELDRDVVALARLEFHPRAAIGDQLGGGQVTAGGAILFRGEVNAGAADELAYDHALGAVDDEGALLRHQGEVAHEDIGDGDLIPGFTVDQRHPDVKRCGIGDVALQADFFAVLGFFEPVLQSKLLRFRRFAGEVEPQVTIKALNRADLVKQFAQALLEEPVERGQLDLDERGQFVNVVRPSVVLNIQPPPHEHSSMQLTPHRCEYASGWSTMGDVCYVVASPRGKAEKTAN